jgi:hypothetical protein
MTQTIIENVTEGTRIVTYKWRAYEKALSLLPDFERQSVNHSIDFVDQMTLRHIPKILKAYNPVQSIL